MTKEDAIKALNILLQKLREYTLTEEEDLLDSLIERHQQLKSEKLATCKTGKHQLIEIYRTGDTEEVVVRWCTECGSVVADLEYDTRLLPGEIMKMKQPRLFSILTT